MKPTVSVIIPNYNHGHCLEACVKSFVEQDDPPEQIIIVDDGSTDESLKVARNLAANCWRIFLISLNHTGVCDAVNAGIESARGDYLYIGAADDIVLPHFFTLMRGALGTNPALVLSIVRVVNKAKGTSYHRGSNIPAGRISPAMLWQLIARDKFMMSVTGCLWRKDALVAAGGFLPSLKWHADWFAFYAIAFQLGLTFCPAVLSEFRQHDSSYSSKGMANWNEQQKVLSSVMQELDKPANVYLRRSFLGSGLLAPFGKEMAWTIIRRGKLSGEFTRCYLALAAWWMLRIEAKKLLPSWAIRLYFKFHFKTVGSQ